MINFNFLQEIRKFELQRAIAHIPPGSHLLELGAGAGWQSKWLSEAGFTVSAIDLANTNYLTHQEYPVVVYDGVHIPFPDAHFDFVFSSNVMEHVLDLTTMHSEVYRVLKPDGIAFHILPSTAWRFWTSVTHPLGVFKATVFV
jgi:2-polyprenyl-3-methyl-5-hydroxy-6-metoxy-1,4-benzoquinol methylase